MNKKIGNDNGSKSHTVYLMLCVSTALLFLFFIVISISVEVSSGMLPPGAERNDAASGYLYKNIVLWVFLILAFLLWIYNWVLIAATWSRRNILLNIILVFVQIFGTFINYAVFFVMFFRSRRWPW